MNAVHCSILALVIVGAIVAPTTGVAQRATTDSACSDCPRPRPLMALLMTTGTNIVINRFDTWVLKVHDPVDGYWTRVSPGSWRDNIRSGWVWDADNFTINMFGHPYQGGSYFRTGRTNGLSFWGSIPVTFLGSAQWEFFAETTKPSLNDFYNTGFGGIAVGEMVYRLVLLIRDNESRGAGRVLRELAAFPLDPAGSVHRLLAGDFTRVFANPGDRRPPLLALQVQTGARQGRDSTVGGSNVVKGVLIAELNYGDEFETPHARPFDVFVARALVSAGTNPVGELRIVGRLYGREFTSRSTAVRTMFTVRQRFEYTRNPAYKFGGQSVEGGIVAKYSLGKGTDVQAEGYAEAILLGAVDAPGAGAPGTARTYDFGPGIGSDLALSVRVRHFPVFTARYHWSMIHSVSGSPADHFTQRPSVEAALPLTNTLGLGAYAGWYKRRSAFAGLSGDVTTYRDLRAYLVWRTRPRPAVPTPQ